MSVQCLTCPFFLFWGYLALAVLAIIAGQQVRQHVDAAAQVVLHPRRGLRVFLPHPARPASAPTDRACNGR